jgi:4-amino-4-deoxy-L-arabinose transferase-like glycosyltransferase
MPSHTLWTSSDSGSDRVWTISFFAAALLLFLIDLGGVPLRDWDEGTVAQVAKEIYQAHRLDGWIYPTLWGEPYFNKPPLLHGCIAWIYGWFGVHEWTARLPGALLTAGSVPLLYNLARSLLPLQLSAVLGTIVYLTLLPVVRHGRLAMLDGAVVCFFLLLLGATVRSRRDVRWGLGIGGAFALICLTKSIVGLLLLGIALAFLAWDTPRLLRSFHLWGGLLLGSLPVVLWYGAQWHHYGDLFLQVGIKGQTLDRIWQAVEVHSGPPWYYLLELLKYSWPWLLFWPWGLQHLWQERSLSWAKLLLTWTGGYLLVISCMGTKLPWYIFPVYPALALTIGVALTRAWQDLGGWRSQIYAPRSSPKLWLGGLGVLMMGGWAGVIYFSPWGHEPSIVSQIALILATLTLTVSLVLACCQNAQFIAVLGWGWYVSLLVFMTSPFWLWELGEDYPVKPVAQLIRAYTPEDVVVYTSHSHDRPSLNFYSDRLVLSRSPEELQALWLHPENTYFLIHAPDLNLTEAQILGTQEDWFLVTGAATPVSFMNHSEHQDSGI